ncbi:TIM barrel protein [Planobispora rosea]|uniref:TIM barrel protein n=1 Tax=Planobispora rosea TaxID=35762 RepID=UPI00083A4C90|nr:TIM barrel protein [Planobispora rosea]
MRRGSERRGPAEGGPVEGGALRTAGAPISWGVCEVPGWGRQLDRSRVLTEMAELGLNATELGPAGFLPPSPSRCRSLLGQYGLRAVGGFVPVVLHDPHHDPLPEVRATMRAFRDGDVDVVVLAAATGRDGYDAKPVLDARGWKTLLGNLERILRNAREFGRAVTLHPHVGTMVESAEEVERVLDGSAVPLCLDTGHLLIGGTDPGDLARRAAGRVAHVHLKDVDAGLAERVRAGGLTYTQAVREGIYRPLGQGDVDVAGIVAVLRAAGYPGWYVLEQDVILGSRDADPARNVRESLAYLEGL